MSDVEIGRAEAGEQASALSSSDPEVLVGAADPDGGRSTRVKVSVHRLDGGREEGESDSRALTPNGFPIYTPPDADRARWIPVRDNKYVVLGAVDDPNLEPDPGDKSTGRKAIFRFRDGEWVAAYMDPGQPPDGAGIAIKIRLTERRRVIPAVAATSA